MESVLAFLTLSSLLLFTTSSVAARKDPAEYWKDVMKDQPMPEAIQGLLRSRPGSHSPLEEKQKPQEEHNSDAYLQSNATIYHGLDEQNSDAYLRSNATIYHGHEEHKEKNQKKLEGHNLDSCHDGSKQEEEQKKKSFVKDFDPTPNVSVYHESQEDQKKKSFVRDFDPTSQFIMKVKRNRRRNLL